MPKAAAPVVEPKTTKEYRSPSPQAIQRLRESVGWEVSDMAHNLRVTEGVAKAWESGKTDMPPGLWVLLVVQAVYSLSGEEVPEPETIKSLRMAMGWTQEEFASRVSTTARRVWGWETGERPIHPGLWRALRVACALENPDHLSI